MSKKLIRFVVLFPKLLICLSLSLAASCVDSQIGFSLEQTKAKTGDERRAESETGKETRATFLAVGDIMLSRGVNRAIVRAGNPFLPFSRLEDLLGSTDFNFGNLESPVSGSDKRLGRGLVFNAHQHDMAGLVKYNFKILNLANNHALDQGFEGLRFTRKYLDSLDIQSVGVGESKAQAWKAKIVTVNKIRVGFIGASYSSINDGGAVINNYVARIEEIEHLKAAISEMKAESDFIVVTMHAGIEYRRYPNRAQVAFARAAVDAGADLVIGAHPHWIQTFEEYRGKYIFYSLGNFIFDQRKPDTKEGLTLRVALVKREFADSTGETEIEQIELVPVIIEPVGVPRRASPAKTKMILEKIGVAEQIITPAVSNYSSRPAF